MMTSPTQPPTIQIGLISGSVASFGKGAIMNRGYTVYPSLVRDGLSRCPSYNDFKSAKRAPSLAAFLTRLVLVALLVSVHPLAVASTVYWQYTQILWGDTVRVSDLNDLGVILYTGFGDWGIPGGASAIGGPAGGDFVLGYGYGGSPRGGVNVSDINDAGDAFGSAIRLDGVTVPTMWVGGVPFDLTDPANAGLHFNYDPGPKYALNFDLWSLPVVGLPSFFTPDVYHVYWALTNIRHDYVFEYSGFSGTSYGLLTAVVPEPGTLALVLAGMAGALLVARGSSSKRGAGRVDSDSR